MYRVVVAGGLEVLRSAAMASDRDAEGLKTDPQKAKNPSWQAEVSLASDPPLRMDAALGEF